MSGGKRRVTAGLSARTIVLSGVCGLFLVLIGAMNNGIGIPFFVGQGVLFASLIGAILVMRNRKPGEDPDEPEA